MVALCTKVQYNRDRLDIMLGIRDRVFIEYVSVHASDANMSSMSLALLLLAQIYHFWRTVFGMIEE